MEGQKVLRFHQKDEIDPQKIKGSLKVLERHEGEQLMTEF